MSASRLCRQTAMPGREESVLLTLGQPVVEIVAEFSGIPGLNLGVQSLFKIVELCYNVGYNKQAAKQLGERCYKLLKGLNDRMQSYPHCNLNDATNGIESCLNDIQGRVGGWAEWKWWKAFLRQNEIKEDIEESHTEIDQCIQKFQLDAAIISLRWQQELGIKQQTDFRNLADMLASIAIDLKQMVADARKEKASDEILQSFQKIVRQVGEPDIRNGLSRNLADLLRDLEEQLPDMHLQSSEIRRLSVAPISTSLRMDVYQGLYLERRKVIIRELRTATINERTLRSFKREVNIWDQVWKVDRGRHILPFYGFCVSDGGRPCTVSQWQQNGSAISYVRLHNTQIDYKLLIKGIAQGVQILHEMNPPIVHGDLKGGNIMISDTGAPLIANLGLSKIIEDVGVEVTNTASLDESYRWFAPETFDGQEPTMSTMTDIYSLAMTIYELLTHERPFSEIKYNHLVPMHICEGRRPPHPNSSAVLQRGLDDYLWGLITQCWQEDPLRRPTISEVVSTLVNTGCDSRQNTE
ncbi:Protein kinase domain-containing protein [Pleurotus pulmonarius]